jgi:mono/diheme cytochrome c family protein
MVLMKYFLLMVLSIFLWSCNESQPTAPKDINAKDIFTTRCAACHGLDGKMSVSGSKPLHTSALTDEEIIGQIKNGKGAMPPFQGRISDEEIQALSKYVLTLRTP